MEYIKKKFADEDGVPVSFWSTDDNILCKDGKTLRENLNDIVNNFKLVLGDNNTIKLMFGTKELSSVTINGGIVDKDIIVGSVDSNNNISLTGLSAGTYTLKYEDDNGVLADFDVVATMEVV